MIRRIPLHTRTPLGRGKPLERRKPLTAKTAPKGKHWAGSKPPRDTGPDARTRALVLERDGYACVDCGLSVIGQPFDLQHRDARGMGGTSDPLANSPANLITMLRAHHQRVESRTDPADHARGYWLRMGESPLLVPVMYFEESGSGITMWLHADGSLSPDGPEAGEAA